MPPKTAKSRSGSRSKSTEKKVVRSRSASRSRSRAKPKQFSSETKRQRTISRDKPDASPIKATHATKSKTVTTLPRSKATDPGFFCKVCALLPSCQAGSCLVMLYELFNALALPVLVFYLNCLIFTPIQAGQSVTIWGPSIALGHAYIPIDVKRYFDWRIAVVYFLCLLKTMILTKYFTVGIEIAQVVGGKTITYCNNFWLVFIAFQAPIVALFYRPALIHPSFKVADVIIQAIPTIYMMMLLTLVMDSFVLYYQKGLSHVRSLANIISDFYNGREARPLFWGMDFKVLELRIAVCFMYAMVLTMTLAQYTKLGHLNPALAFVFAAVSIRTLDYVLFEHKQLISHQMSNAGCGWKFMAEMKLLFPFMYTYAASFYYMHPEVGKGLGTTCNKVTMGIASVMFMLGYYIYRAAENQQFRFTTDPHHPNFANMEKIPTQTGKKILAGGWWRMVRHPDFLGSELMSWSVLVPMAYTFPHMLLLQLVSTLNVWGRIREISEFSLRKYGMAYVKYITIVPDKMVPRII